MLVRVFAVLAFALGTTCPLSAQCETHKLTPQYPSHRSGLGIDVALEGDTAAVGGWDSQFMPSATVYQRIDDDWIETDQLVFGKAWGNWPRVAMSRDTLLIGAFAQERVGVFQNTGGTWSYVQYLFASPSMWDAHFGRRLAIDGDRLVVAAPMDATYFYRGGSVFVFERIAGVWTQTAKIEPEAPRSFGFFGLAIALDGDTLVIGEPGYALSGAENRVFVYRQSGGKWTLEKRWVGAYGTGFGYAVAVEGDRLAVGAFRDASHGGPNLGSVTLYERQGTWIQVGQIHGDGAQVGDGFGARIALHGDSILTGSGGPEFELGAAVHLHRWAAGWPLERTFLPHDDGNPKYGSAFGAAVALNDETILVGSPGDEPDSNVLSTGAAYFYTREELTEVYCGPANLNSLGLSGLIDSAGCPTLAIDDLRLSAHQIPPHRVGMFLLSRERDFKPFSNGSQGNLCLGGVIGRFSDQVGDSGPAGELELVVNLLDLPIIGGGYSAERGETWNFQCWYRDSNPAPTSNYTNAIAVSIR